MSRVPSLLLALGLLAGCATTPPTVSYVGGLADRDGAGTAITITNIVASRLKPAGGPLLVIAPPGDKVVAPWLVADLRKAGFTVAVDEGQPHRDLHYDVQPLEGGILIHVTTSDLDAAGMFQRANFGLLVPTGPVMVREAAR